MSSIHHTNQVCRWLIVCKGRESQGLELLAREAEPVIGTWARNAMPEEGIEAREKAKSAPFKCEKAKSAPFKR